MDRKALRNAGLAVGALLLAAAFALALSFGAPDAPREQGPATAGPLARH